MSRVLYLLVLVVHACIFRDDAGPQMIRCIEAVRRSGNLLFPNLDFGVGEGIVRVTTTIAK